MRLEFHPQVASDISTIRKYYEAISGPQLADDFYAELRGCFLKAGEFPESYSVRVHDLRRVNPERFPYHFLFRINGDAAPVLVVRHHRRDPTLAIRRR